MKENFKIEKELLFKTNIKDIISISLDREFKIYNNEVRGNFLINGEYKIHEISVNKESFNFKIPFKYELKNDIDKDSIDVEIIDFVYDYNKDELIVNIEYEISGDRKDVLIFDDEESLDDFLQSREVEVIDTRVNEVNEIVEEKEEVEEKEINQESLELEIEKDDDRNSEININIEDSKESIEADSIVNNIGNIEDKFITYKIYKVSETDTLEGLVIKFHTTIDELKEYNDLSNINTGDKLIIPYYE